MRIVLLIFLWVVFAIGTVATILSLIDCVDELPVELLRHHERPHSV